MEAVPITEEHINIDELKALADKYKKQQERCRAYHLIVLFFIIILVVLFCY